MCGFCIRYLLCDVHVALSTLSKFPIILLRERERERESRWLYFIVYLLSCDCFESPPHSAVGLSVVCDCDILLAYSLTF